MWSSKKNKAIQVHVPRAVEMYYQRMGGIDLCDPFVASYRMRVRSKKWWFPLFAWGMNMACVNPWRLYTGAYNVVVTKSSRRHFSFSDRSFYICCQPTVVREQVLFPRFVLMASTTTLSKVPNLILAAKPVWRTNCLLVLQVQCRDAYCVYR